MRTVRVVFFLSMLAATAAAQNLSPFAPPPFTADPGTCYVGQIYTNTAGGVQKWCGTTNFWFPIVAGPSSATTIGNVPTWGSTVGGVLQVGLAVSATTANNALVETNGAGTIDVSFMPAYFPGLLVNDGTTGTTVNSLAKVTASGTAIRAGTTDTAVPVFIVTSGAGTSGSATLAKIGKATCTFDASGGTIAHFVVNSTATAGRCSDAGGSPPGSGWVIGQLLTTASANGTGLVDLDAGYYGAAGGGGGVSSIGFTTPTNGFTFSSSTTNPITSTGTITLGFANESAGIFFAGPCSGGATTPGWRALCVADIPGAVNTVSFSGTPNFDLSAGGIQTITLTGNVTSSTFSNGVAGKRYTFIVCQDGTGGRSFVWPSGFHGTMGVGATASLCSAQTFDASTSSVLYASAAGLINQ